MSERVRVLVVDDSALMRKLIPNILERDPSIEVVGTAMDGAFALKKIEELRPDVVTLDLEMPRMDGMETLRMIMQCSASGSNGQHPFEGRRVRHFQSASSGRDRLRGQTERSFFRPSGYHRNGVDREN